MSWIWIWRWKRSWRWRCGIRWLAKRRLEKDPASRDEHRERNSQEKPSDHESDVHALVSAPPFVASSTGTRRPPSC